MIVQSIHYTFAPENGNRVEGMLRDLRDASLAEEGVVAFEVGRSQDKPNVFALWEGYRDQDAMDAHARTEHFRRFVIDGVRQLATGRDAERVVPI